MRDLSIVILASGENSRFKSPLPKAAQKLAGQPMLNHVLTSARALQPQEVIVVFNPHKSPTLPALFPDEAVQWVAQPQQDGTGGATACAIDQVSSSQVLVLYADVPLLTVESLKNLVAQGTGKLALMTKTIDDPHGYGRILRDQHGVVKVIEQIDADPQQQKIEEVFTGVLTAPTAFLKKTLPLLPVHPEKKEQFLPDLVPVWAQDQGPCLGMITTDPYALMGINSMRDLERCERVYQRQIAAKLQDQGVRIIDVERFDCRGSLHCEPQVTIDSNCLFIGEVTLGEGTEVGMGSILKHVTIGRHVTIHPYSVLHDTHVEDHATIGPFAHLRGNTYVASKAHIGVFAEVNRSHIGVSAKAKHHCYLGDAQLGEGVNVGAGTVTANYDGVNKHPTTIGDGCYLGTNNSLVAPLTLGKKVTTAAGSTLTQDVPDRSLAIARQRQRNVEGWRPDEA